jgi:hypothetical protein
MMLLDDDLCIPQTQFVQLRTYPTSFVGLFGRVVFTVVLMATISAVSAPCFTLILSAAVVAAEF